MVVPLLILLVVGIAEFGRAYHIQTTLSAAAREGVRVMALTDDQAQARSAAKSAAAQLNPPLADGQIVFSPSACSTDQQVTSTVTYPMDFLTGLLGQSGITLTGQGTMRCNG